jgi:hypothetical protein
MTTFNVIYDNGEVVEGLSYEESLKLFYEAHGTSNQARVYSSDYGKDLTGYDRHEKIGISK